MGSVASFLVAIAETTQNWRDMLQRARPARAAAAFTVRHRQTRAASTSMEKDAIDAMARSGARAAAAIQEDFLAPPGTPPKDDDWEHHRWVRLRLLLPVLREFLGNVSAGASARGASPSIQDLLTAVPPPMGRSHELNQASRAAAWTLLDDVSRAMLRGEAAKPDFERTAPRPPGELRVMPTF